MSLFEGLAQFGREQRSFRRWLRRALPSRGARLLSASPTKPIGGLLRGAAAGARSARILHPATTRGSERRPDRARDHAQAITVILRRVRVKRVPRARRSDVRSFRPKKTLPERKDLDTPPAGGFTLFRTKNPQGKRRKELERFNY